MPSPVLRHALATALASAAAVLMASCGGGGGADGASPAPVASGSGTAIARVVVAGDSLADVGTFGLKATVQRAADRATGYPLYPELVAARLGLGRLCNHFSSTDGKTFSTHAGCTDYAVGGAQVANPITRGGSLLPFSLGHQLEAAVAANGGAWGAGDLVIVDAGANDAATLADAWRDARAGRDADKAVFVALLAQQLDATAIAQALAQADGESVAAGRYMQQLAQTDWATVKANTLDKGATRVALLNVPDITRTPRYRQIVAEMAAARGAAEAAAFESALRQWIVGFNTALAGAVAGEPRVALVPYFEDFSAQTADPARFGLSNVSEAACAPAGDFPACTDAALDAAPPPGLAAGWWMTWFYSDRFHPSPRGHALLADTVLQALARAGWR